MGSLFFFLPFDSLRCVWRVLGLGLCISLRHNLSLWWGLVWGGPVVLWGWFGCFQFGWCESCLCVGDLAARVLVCLLSLVLVWGRLCPFMDRRKRVGGVFFGVLIMG